MADYFTSDNSPVETGAQNDDDLGSGGALLLPILNDAMGNPHELAVGAGKDGNAYVVDRNNMGKYNMSSNAVYQKFALGGSVFSSPAWFNNTLYYGAMGQQINAYPYSGGSFGSSSSHTSVSAGFGNNGATPSISANGSSNGIVWAVTSGGSPAILYAFNAANLNELYDTTQAASSRDSFGDTGHFPTPTVFDGKVYVGTTTGVAIFGLLTCTYTVSQQPPTSPTTFSVDVTTGAGCSWSANSDSDFITITSGASGTGNGTVNLQLTAYEGAIRTGIISVAGRVLSITQTGANSLGLPSGPSPANGSVGAPVTPTLTWTASSGATSYDIYFGTSPTPPLVTNTTSTSYAPGTLVPGITYYWIVVAENSGGTNNSPVWSFTTTNATVVSVTPSSGTVASHSFALQYSDTAGAASLQTVWVYFNNTLANPASNSCLLYYNVAANLINLAQNSGTAWASATPGAATTLQNSQCSLNVASTTVSLSGNTLTLTLPMTFLPAYAGAKNIYMYAADISGSNSGWQQPGTWTVPAGSGTPAVVSVTPNSGTVASQSFALQYSDTAGAGSLQTVWVYFNSTLADPASNSCLLYYNVAANLINLAQNSGTAWVSATPGAATTLQNSQCSLNVAATTATLNGNTLTLTLPMTFRPAYAGAKNIYLYAADISGSNSGWQQPGTWTVPAGSGTPAAVSVTPNSGTVASQSFALQYSDTAGAGSLQTVWVYFSSTLADPASNSCLLYYNVAANQINLAQNSGTAWVSATPAAATTLQNSQCSLNVAATTATLNGNTLTLNLPMTFLPAYAGAKNIYLYAADVSGSNSGWHQPGTWTVP